jgi:15-cis-phytoene synthase
MEKNNRAIFKKGSRTYFYSSVFFPQKIKREVFILYAFVRTADDYVDQIPQDEESFRNFCDNFDQAWQGNLSGDEIIDDFVKLAKEKEFKKEWIDAFLSSMAADLSQANYQTITDTLKYIYGSAEVIGLMMAKLMNLPSDSYQGARLLGRAMQQINFIRDIKEDIDLGRQYLPIDEMKYLELKSLNQDLVYAQPFEYMAFIKKQLSYYNQWQKEAESYFHFIPIRYRIPIQTASAMYNYTAKKIAKEPLVVFDRKIKPGKTRIILTGLKQIFLILCSKLFQNTKRK